MKQNKTVTFEVELILSSLSAALSRGRLLRGETQSLAAQRANVSIATYVRMESQDIKQLAGIGVAGFLEALCAVGYRDVLMSIADARNDVEGGQRLERIVPKRGRSLIGDPNGG